MDFLLTKCHILCIISIETILYSKTPVGWNLIYKGDFRVGIRISEKGAKVAPSSTLAIDAKFKAMKAEGIDAVGFGTGEPDFDTPEIGRAHV